jgi:hypothetical protein
MGIMFGVQPVITEDGVELHSLRTGATDDDLLWFKAVGSGVTVSADEIEGKPGVMSTQRARGEAGKARLLAKLQATIKERT